MNLLFADGLFYDSSPRFRYRILLICLVAWLPLLILTFFSGLGLESFLNDFDIHVRFLISLPLMLYAQTVVNSRFKILVLQFLKCKVISESDHKKYKKLITSTYHISNSLIVEIIFLFLVLTTGPWISNNVLPHDISNWYTYNQNNISSLNLPGYWYIFVSLPIFQFVLLRWLFRIAVVYLFFWRVAKFHLHLNSLHPDQAGGIGFLVNIIYGLEPFLLANSFLLAGLILNTIINTNATLFQFQNEMITWIVILILIPLIPMLFFITQMTHAKRNGTLQYDVIASRYVTEFKCKWLDTSTQDHAKLLGTPDIQSLADLTNSFNVSAHMRTIPVSKNSIFFLIIVTALPFLPLIFTLISLEKILSQIVSVLF